jgi:plasmid maintenance system killer protein
MIGSFKHKGLEQFFRQGSKKGIQPKHATKLCIQLAALDNAKDVADVAVPAWRLHALRRKLPKLPGPPAPAPCWWPMMCLPALIVCSVP